MSNSSRITYAEPVKLEKWPRPSIQRRLSWPLLVHSNCFTWTSLDLIITQQSLMMHLYMVLSLLMITLDIHGYTLLLTNMKCRKSSNDFPRGLQPTLVWRSSTSEVTMELSSRILVLMTILMNLVLLMSYLLLILLSRMASWSARTGLLLRWLALCLMNTKRLVVSGLRQLILRATSSTEYIFTNSSRRLPMNSSLTRNPMWVISKSSVLNVGLEILITILNLHRKHMKVLCLVTERTRTPTESSTTFFTRLLKL